MKNGVPAGSAYRMPAEWEPHEATWIAWPHHRADWPGKFDAIPLVYGEIVRQLHLSEEVRILVNGPAGERRARAVLDNLSLDWERVAFWTVPTNRVWTRDYGPMFVTTADGKAAVVRWCFNAWAKYPNCQRDDAVSTRVHRQLSRTAPLDLFQPTTADQRGIVLEGGSIDVNGQGCLLTTKECLLSKVQERNPGFTRKNYERLFAQFLGVRKTLWLGRGIAGDDTHGHIDDLARFVGPRTVVAMNEDNPRSENHRPLRDNLELLRGMTDQDDKRLNVVPLPMPDPVMWAGQRLPASYANFYIANDRVLVPTFNDANDQRALGILADLFPQRRVIGIHAVDLAWGFGTLHCLTQQQPLVRKAVSSKEL